MSAGQFTLGSFQLGKGGGFYIEALSTQGGLGGADVAIVQLAQQGVPSDTIVRHLFISCGFPSATGLFVHWAIVIGDVRAAILQSGPTATSGRNAWSQKLAMAGAQSGHALGVIAPDVTSQIDGVIGCDSSQAGIFLDFPDDPDDPGALVLPAGGAGGQLLFQGPTTGLTVTTPYTVDVAGRVGLGTVNPSRRAASLAGRGLPQAHYTTRD